MNETVKYLVQASSKSWAGGIDLSMSSVDGFPVVYWCIKRVFENIPNVQVTVIAPEFDKGGGLSFLKDAFVPRKLDILYAFDQSPLERMIAATAHMEEGAHVVRVDGLHMFFDSVSAVSMLGLAKQGGYDCVKFPDDYPIQLTCEVYRVGALRRLRDVLERLSESQAAPYYVHPKFFMMHHREFNSTFFRAPSVPEQVLKGGREIAKKIYNIPRGKIGTRETPAGDQLRFHYELARKWLDPIHDALDIACGDGFGCEVVADTVKSIVGADLDATVVREAQEKCKFLPNASFRVEDVTQMSFSDRTFDRVLSMETIEHVDGRRFLNEVARVLRPNGKLILSTPQNSQGHIPINPTHVIEYSLNGILELVKRVFEVEGLFALKAGRIFFEGDNIGTNTFLVLRKKG